MSFGKRLGALVRVKRAAEGWTLRELSLRAFGDEDAKAPWLSALENGLIRRPHSKNVDLVCLALGITPETQYELRFPKEDISVIERTKNVRISRITSTLDEMVPKLLSLYAELFYDEDEDSFGASYETSDLYFIMNKDMFEGDRHVACENIILSAFEEENPIGLLFAHFYTNKRKAIVSFFGNAGRPEVSEKLIKTLNNILNKDNKCDIVFFDLYSKNKKEASKRAIIFKHRTKSVGLHISEFSIDYICPKVAIGNEYQESLARLFAITTNEMPKHISKKNMIEYLEFIYFDCYGDFYKISDPLFISYQEYLKNIVDSYKVNLPDMIHIK